MRNPRILLGVLAFLALPTASMATEGVVSLTGRWNTIPAATTAKPHSWSSPLATAAAGKTPSPGQLFQNAFTEPRRYSVATEWIARATVLALAATGTIYPSGSHDDTGDIRKPPRPVLNQNPSAVGEFSGSIR